MTQREKNYNSFHKKWVFLPMEANKSGKKECPNKDERPRICVQPAWLGLGIDQFVLSACLHLGSSLVTNYQPREQTHTDTHKDTHTHPDTDT